MVSTASDTRIDPVMLVRNGPVTEVWLRKNIEHRTVVNDGGGEQQMWFADEAHGIVPGTPAAAEIEGDFDALWDRFETDGMTDRELVNYRATQLTDALASSLGDTEQATATENHAVGSYLTWDGTLWRVTAPIARGERIRDGVNVTPTSVAAELLMMRERNEG